MGGWSGDSGTGQGHSEDAAVRLSGQEFSASYGNLLSLVLQTWKS